MNRRRVSGSILLIICATLAPRLAAEPAARAVSASAPAMVPGKWQITYHTISPAEAPPMTSTFCVDAGRAAEVGIPAAPKENGCKLVSPAFDGQTLSYGIACTKTGVSSTFSAVYRGTSYHAVSTVTSGGATVTLEIDAVRLGVCDE